MTSHPLHALQRGATLVVGLIMLALITLMVTAAFQLSMGNQQSVGNMQFRDQAIAAANFALETVLAGDLSNRIVAAQQVGFDLDNNNLTDMNAIVGPPQCVAVMKDVNVRGSSEEIEDAMKGFGDLWSVLLDFDVRVNDNVTGANIRIRSGHRILMRTPEKDSWCS